VNVEPGDLAEVIQSVDGASIGMIVQVIEFKGHHSLYGPVWTCRSKSNIVTEYGGVGNTADFADDWLRRIKAPPLPEKVLDKELINE
jgi:hypothetical protein